MPTICLFPLGHTILLECRWTTRLMYNGAKSLEQIETVRKKIRRATVQNACCFSKLSCNYRAKLLEDIE